MAELNLGSQGAEEPCLVKAGQGFSVFYRQRFLYSKYSPQKVILQTIENLNILDETLCLAFSPCLCYGLKELCQKLDSASMVVCVEADKKLYELADKKIEELKAENPEFQQKIILTKSADIESLIKNLPHFRRSLAIEMSGGTFFYKKLYSNIAGYAQNFIASFWKNRVTLVKFGRLFSRNLFKNLKLIPSAKSIPLSSPLFFRPIIVFGAGESIQSFLEKTSKETLKKCTIFAVDAALQVLLKTNVEPDFVIAVESQLAIEKAYIGTAHSNFAIIGDLASRPCVLRHANGKNLFFYSEYANAAFLKNADNKGILPQKLDPLGSVGLTAVELALKMRFNQNIPVIISGLDFSYSQQLTHARGTPAHTNRLLFNSRLKSVENYAAALKKDAKKISSNEKTLITDTALSNYAILFKDYFSNTKNLFDARDSGFDLALPHVSSAQLTLLCKELKEKTADEYDSLFKVNKCEFNLKQKETRSYILQEKAALERIKELLSKGEKALPPPEPSLEIELKNLLTEREYLYLHFPDGYKCNTADLSFLKRIRNEIDFFLKDFE